MTKKFLVLFDDYDENLFETEEEVKEFITEVLNNREEFDNNDDFQVFSLVPIKVNLEIIPKQINITFK